MTHDEYVRWKAEIEAMAAEIAARRRANMKGIVMTTKEFFRRNRGGCHCCKRLEQDSCPWPCHTENVGDAYFCKGYVMNSARQEIVLKKLEEARAKGMKGVKGWIEKRLTKLPKT